MIDLLVAADENEYPPMLTRLTSLDDDWTLVFQYAKEWFDRYPKRKITINFIPDKEVSQRHPITS